MPPIKRGQELHLRSGELKDKGWTIMGKKTYDFRHRFREAGGIWNRELSAWVFKTNPENLVETLNKEIDEEENLKKEERVKKAKKLATQRLQAEEHAKQKAEEEKLYNLQMTDPTLREEVNEVSRLLFASRPNGSFWPLEEGRPFCYCCKRHVLWMLYLAANRDLQRAAMSYEMMCPKCLTDFTN